MARGGEASTASLRPSRSYALASLLIATGANALQISHKLQPSPLPALAHAASRAVPAMISSRKTQLDKEVDAEKMYGPTEAVALMKKLANAKFVETAELHGNLNLDPKYNDQQMRTVRPAPPRRPAEPPSPARWTRSYRAADGVPAAWHGQERAHRRARGGPRGGGGGRSRSREGGHG